MSDSAAPSPPARPPLTPRGVATLAGAGLRRLLLVQFCFAAFAAGCVVWFLCTAWLPVVAEAIRQLPPGAEFRSGVLRWGASSPLPLADGHFLALAVDLDHTGRGRVPAHFLVEFGRRDCLVLSLLGSRAFPYPPSLAGSLDRASLEPLWGAWRPAILAAAAAGTILGLMCSWTVLATLYSLPLWLAARCGHRALPWSACWRLAGASLMPGALVMSLAVLAYGLALLDLVHLGLAFVVHLAVGWGVVAAGAISAPRQSPSRNPFAPEPQTPPPVAPAEPDRPPEGDQSGD